MSDPSDTVNRTTGIDLSRLGAATDVTSAGRLFDAMETGSDADNSAARRRPQADTDESNDATVSDDDTRSAQGGTDPEDDDTAHASGDDPGDDVDDWPDDLKERKFRRMINGQVVEVTLGELEKGYHRQSDYTRKTQELATHRSQYEQGARENLGMRQQLDQTLRAAHSLVTAQLPQEPNWAALAQDPDPRALSIAQVAWSQQQQKLGQIAQMIQLNQQAASGEVQQLTQAQQREAWGQMLQLNPDWNDEKVRARDQRAISEYAVSRGFKAEELNGITDPRIIGVLRDAAKFRQAAKARQDKTQSQPQQAVEQPRQVRASTPGAAQTQRPNRAAQEDRDRLRKTGHLRDAAKVFERFV